MIREIVKFGSRVLRQKAAPIAEVGVEVEMLIEDLFDSMHAAEGVGLAAPQLGVLKRVIVVDISGQEPAVPPLALINPVLVCGSGSELAEEGCLSLPELYGEVPRHSRIEVEALDARGTPFSLAAEGFHARVLQHEIDHLEGRLFIDYLSPLKRQLMRGALRRLKKEGEAWDRAHTLV